jgi:hypothetical protein
MDSEIIYYNSNFTNANNDSSVIVNYTDLRSNPILKNPSDYYMSVVRFSVDGSNIPIFNFTSNDNGTPDNTYYKITISSTIADYTQNVIYINGENGVSLVQPNPVWSYQSFINMINNAFFTAFNLIPLVERGGAINPPFLIYNPQQYLFYLVVDSTANAYTNGSLTVHINYNINAFFQNFANVIYTSSSITTVKNVTFRIQNFGQNIFTNITCPQNGNIIASGIYISQEYQNIYVWSELTRIIITSSNLPINTEFVSIKNDFSTSTNQSLRIISDFIPLLDSQPGSSQTVFIYLPTAEYRYIEMQGNSGITKIDFQVYWVDRFNNLRPIYLAPGASFTIKIVFKKKNLIKNYDF